MRTTVTLEDDVVAAVAKLRRERGVGMSEAVNRLARAGMGTVAREDRPPFRQQTYELGVAIDVRDVAEALEIAEGPDHK